MPQAIAGFFRTPAEGEAARQALLSGGFSAQEVSVVTADTRRHDTPAVGPVEQIGAEAEAGGDAMIGGGIGLLAGVVAVALPGIGPLLAIGPLAGALGGLGIGAAAGGIIGLLKDHGISEEEAEFYAEGVKRGGALVTVHETSEDRAKQAQEILDNNGAIEVEDLTQK